MKSRLKSTITFLLVFVLLSIAGFIMSNGLSVGMYNILPIDKSLNFGLDLTGGVYVVLEAGTTDGNAIDSDAMNRAVATIRERIDNLGVSEPVIARQGENKIRVSIPDIQDRNEALDLIGKTAQLEFVDPNGDVVITGEHVQESNAVYQTNESGQREAVVTLKLNSEGTEAFADATRENTGEVIEIRLDDEVISAPAVQTEITDGEAVITGMANLNEAGDLAMLIQAGALPVELEPVEVRTVGPTLGQDSLDKSIVGGAIGISLVLIFMLLYYRVPGFIASVTLAMYIIIYFFVMIAVGVTLTLPGIAGMILSVGMAVDANVIIFERIKEELKLGKSLMASIDAGFKRALTSIIDGSLTTVLAGVVLFFLGSGTVRGFAVTLIIGVIVSMFTALTVTKRLLKTFVNTGLIKNTKMYGA